MSGKESARMVTTFTVLVPTVPGWYWWRHPKCGTSCVQVIECKGVAPLSYLMVGSDDEWYVENSGGEWCGPIEVPT